MFFELLELTFGIIMFILYGVLIITFWVGIPYGIYRLIKYLIQKYHQGGKNE